MYRGEFLVERCNSGIPGFDELCGGGFVRNSVNALLGGPGAGKTIFLLEFLYHGATVYNENGLYISFEPDIVEIFKDARVFDWDLQKLDDEGKCKFMRVSPQTELPELKRDLTKMIAQFDIKRVCFDPISLFKASESNQAKLRELVFDLASLLKRLNVTVILADETASGDTEEVGLAGSDVRSQYIKFLVDGIIDIYSSGLGGLSDRAVRIAKMRRTNHSRGPIPMMINDKGMFVLSKKNKEML